MQTIKTSIWTIRSTFKGRSVERWEGGFAKVWLPNPRAGPDCKIIQSHIPLGYWSNDSDLSFHSLHEEIGLHLICSLVIKRNMLDQIFYMHDDWVLFIPALPSWIIWFCLPNNWIAVTNRQLCNIHFGTFWSFWRATAKQNNCIN